jgi:MFS family permease
MTLVAIRLIDRIGRKPLLLGGLVGIIASPTVLGLSALLLSEPSSPNDPVAIITRVLCLAVFIASFAAAWGPMVRVMLPEVLPLRIRGTAMGVAIFALDCQLYRRPDVSQLARLRRA